MSSNFSKRYKYPPSQSCDEISVIIEEEIKNVAIKTNRHLFIGGPTMIIKISPEEKLTWVKNKPIKSEFLTNSEMRRQYKNGKIKIHFLSEEMKRKYDESLSE